MAHHMQQQQQQRQQQQQQQQQVLMPISRRRMYGTDMSCYACGTACPVLTPRVVLAAAREAEAPVYDESSEGAPRNPLV